MLKHSFLILIGAIISVLPKVALAKTEKIVIVTEHLPPYQIVDEQNNVSGFATEIIHEVMARAKYPYQLNAYSWVRSYNLASMKANHCIYSIARTPFREKLFKWIGPITEINNLVIWGLKKNSYIQIETIEDAKKYTIAVNKNDVTHLALLEKGFKEGENLYVLNNTESLIKLLASRPEIELIVADDITLAYRAELAGVDVNSLQRVFEMEDVPLNFNFACSLTTNDNVINKFKAVLAEIHEDGTYNKILNNWRNKMSHIDK
ncbi:substrate-binding periplasmic protein [Colwelliaceae bacterium 6471]